MGKIELKYQVPSYVIFVVVGFLILQFGLASYKNFQLERRIETLINWDKAMQETPPDAWEVQGLLAQKAKELGLPIKAADIVITGSDYGLAVSIDYTYSVNLIVTRVPWAKHIRIQTES